MTRKVVTEEELVLLVQHLYAVALCVKTYDPVAIGLDAPDVEAVRLHAGAGDGEGDHEKGAGRVS
jgi:hypothetical protein